MLGLMKKLTGGIGDSTRQFIEGLKERKSSGNLRNSIDPSPESSKDGGSRLKTIENAHRNGNFTDKTEREAEQQLLEIIRAEFDSHPSSSSVFSPTTTLLFISIRTIFGVLTGFFAL